MKILEDTYRVQTSKFMYGNQWKHLTKDHSEKVNSQLNFLRKLEVIISAAFAIANLFIFTL